MSHSYFKVAVDAPLPQVLTYLPPEETDNAVARGTSVNVPLGKRSAKAVIVDTTDDPGEYKLKKIKNTISERPTLPEPFMKWLEWLSSYYKHPIGQVMSLAFPPLKKQTKPRKSNKAPVVPDMPKSEPPILTEEQTACLNGILKDKSFNVHLLFGVTGSGKTEVYLNVLEDVIASGKKGLVLVPEISLTPQLVNRFSARFPGQIAVIHSHLTEREKTNQWWNVIEGDKKILIGARSAMFCPVADWGAIIVDEEHEPSFKQDEKLKYHARDSAIKLAQLHNCPIILGSATPSIETWHNVNSGKFQLHEMKKRVSDVLMPEVHVVDMRDERQGRKDEEENDLPFWMSQLLYEKLKITYENKQQSALFLNRRGMAQTVVCQSCGHLYECPDCSISLTLHANSYLVCHYCNYTETFKEKCPECSSEDVKPLGLGTELLENDIRKLFPEAEVARADRDEIQNRDDLEDLISRMEKSEIDILIGTQMIAKGLDFPALTMVGLVMADVGFNMPDFRSSERSFQLLTQVSGRSGRHIKEAGQVVIQTYNPEHVSIVFTQKNDYAGFAQQELETRQDFMYPPYGRLASLRVQGTDVDKVKSTAQKLTQRANILKTKSEDYERIQVLGPTPSPLAKIRRKFRFLILVKAPDARTLSRFSQQMISDLSWVPTSTKVQIDIDPINML